MSDTRTAAGVMLTLGIIAAFAVMLYGGDGPTQPFLASFPVFDNPFDRGITVNLGLASGGPGYGLPEGTHAVGSNQGCSQAEFWRCVIDANGTDDSTYVSLGAPENGLTVNTTGWPTTGKVRYGTIAMRCRTNDTTAVQMTALLNSWGPAGGGGPPTTVYLDNEGGQYCRSALTFSVVTIHMSVIVAPPTDLGANPFPPNLQLEIFQLNANFYPNGVQISKVEFTAFVSDPSDCNGADFFSRLGCSFVQFFQEVSNWLQFIVNGISWVFAWVLVVINYVAGFFAVIVWLYAIPGMPGPIQAFVDIVLTVYVGIFLLIIAHIVRGTEG